MIYFLGFLSIVTTVYALGAVVEVIVFNNRENPHLNYEE